ncbi:phosphonate C-P lyase system protein PhnG [Cytobacillus oceanisediminis]|uniref:Phosphonate C-P lyase system protein PhnG n=1 Tax=Niallia alba TaxID=2729105 RepID=A0A7Y0K653_9BACI|nr:MULTISPECIES: phosphonate C-P lyase system protein PhnG [Bacillaceae]EOR24324.1 phosphonate C-P lyase system protein PhnG [Niallia nealsonii AAU1]MBZ9536210.1 phosphonate C-P lyase system protein PhnG [Cytobacillus oceanisediminis]NMO76237.1 phosphonate C-P lyase system protein PhnG [Niallia alba]
MKRRRRTEILINGSLALAEKMAKMIHEYYEVVVIQEPENGLVMMKVRETSKKTLFYPGEVFVTECKVKVHESIGIGIVAGDQPTLAHHLAIIDAAFQAELPETNGWIELLEQEEQAILIKKATENKAILKTKVNFETMDVS